MSFEIVPAALVDYAAVCEDRPSQAMRGYAVRKKGRAVAVAGLYESFGHLLVFASIKEAIGRKTIARVCHRMMGLMRSTGVPIYAYRDATLPTSASLLAHFDFHFVADTEFGELYRFENIPQEHTDDQHPQPHAQVPPPDGQSRHHQQAAPLQARASHPR